MATEPGVPSPYAEAPAAMVGDKPTTPRQRTNHMFIGPDYSVVHPGIFPHNTRAAELATIREWLTFDWRAGWGTDEFEDSRPDDFEFPERWRSIDDRYDAHDLIAENLALLDEAMAAVLTGRLDPYYTGAPYCNVIEACLGIADVRRAGEWTEASLTWCASLPPASPYPALCRANRAELARLVGEWDEALAAAEALVGSSRPERTDPEVAASAHELIGEIRRRTGDLAGAEEAFGHAQAGGRDAQPGLALLRLAQGKVGAAQAAIRLASSGDTDLSLRRAPLLTARVEVEVAAGDLASARAALGDLETIAQDFPTATMNVACDVARGRIALAEGGPPASATRRRRPARSQAPVRHGSGSIAARLGAPSHGRRGGRPCRMGGGPFVLRTPRGHPRSRGDRWVPGHGPGPPGRIDGARSRGPPPGSRRQLEP